VLHALLGITDDAALSLHSSVGASWEGFVLEQILAHLRTDQAFFWQTQSGAELDLLAITDGKRIGFEMKLSESPRTTKSMRIAIQDLHLDHLYVLHPSELRFALYDHITALPAREIPSLTSASFSVLHHKNVIPELLQPLPYPPILELLMWKTKILRNHIRCLTFSEIRVFRRESIAATSFSKPQLVPTAMTNYIITLKWAIATARSI